MPQAPAVNPEAVGELLTQLAFLSTLLGGFAATFLGTLLTMVDRRRIVDWAIASSAIAAVAFVLTALLGATGGASFNANVPSAVLVRRLTTTEVLFGVGLLPLLAAIGLSGWIRSRAVGMVTSGAAAAGALVIVAILFEI